MKLIKMKYKDFEFPQNPTQIKISTKNSVKENVLISNKTVTNKPVQAPCVVSAQGELYGDSAGSCCEELRHILRSGDAGWLFLPSGEAVYCYFTELALSQSSQKGAISYSAVFTEADTKRQEKKHFSFTYATEGENAFDIAYREGISVSELMRLNDFKTPFDIKSGDRVVLE